MDVSRLVERVRPRGGRSNSSRKERGGEIRFTRLRFTVLHYKTRVLHCGSRTSAIGKRLRGIPAQKSIISRRGFGILQSDRAIVFIRGQFKIREKIHVARKDSVFKSWVKSVVHENKNNVPNGGREDPFAINMPLTREVRKEWKHVACTFAEKQYTDTCLLCSDDLDTVRNAHIEGRRLSIYRPMLADATATQKQDLAQ